MRIGGQVIGGFAALLAIQTVTSLVALALLGRMSPAIEKIMMENVASIEAVEQMAIALGAPGGGDASQYRQALDRARRNVTEESEWEPIGTLERRGPLALGGDAQARRDATQALMRLGQINRDAMARASKEAERLGTAGAWTVTFLSIVALAVSFLAMFRTTRRILRPLAELARVVTAFRAGDRHRRCSLLPVAGGSAIDDLAVTLNQLLDHYYHGDAPLADPTRERLLLLSLLDARSDAAAIVDSKGDLVAANRVAERAFAGPGGAELRESLRGEAASEATSSPIGEGGDRLWVWSIG